MWKELAKRVNAQKVEGKLRRGRPKMRWGIALIVTQKEWEKNGQKEHKIE